MPFYTDQTNRIIDIAAIPKRIVSLVPSQTELLSDLGLEDEVIGITKFCIHPDKWFHEKTRVGGTKTVNIEKIRGLQPDLILANKEENVKEQVEILAENFPVWVSDISTLDEAIAMIRSIGEITNREEKAVSLVDLITSEFSQFTMAIPDYRTVYLIWKDPYMTIGHDTFIHDLMKRTGFANVFADRSRYPEVTISDLQAANCDVLLLSSEPYPFTQKHIEALQPLLPRTKILLADGEMFSWYGSRLLMTPCYIKRLHAQINGLL